MDVLSIDFGTSSTVGVLSAFGRGPRAIEVDGSVTMSSAVYAGDDGLLVVGQDAERRARLDPSRFEPNPKRRIDDGRLLLGERTYDVADAFAAVLRRMGEETERQLSRGPGQVRISHPAGWGAARQQTLRDAATRAGFTNVHLVPEPVAAAAHYATLRTQTPHNGPLAVYDLGAGTFDCAVVGIGTQGFSVLAEDGLPDLGSLDIDQALLVHVGRSVSHADPAQWQQLLRPENTGDRRRRRALLQDVRDAKESLSRHQQTEVPMPDPFGDVLVTRAELEALVRPSLLRSAELLAATIRRAGLAPGQLGGVYLVGGPSRMPLLAGLLGSTLGVVPTTQDQPETAVAFGLHHVPLGDGGPSLTVPAFAPVRPPAARPDQAWPSPRQSQPVAAYPAPHQSQPVAVQQSQPVAPQAFQPPSQQSPVQLWQPPKKSAKKPILIGAGALVLVAIVAVVLVLTLGAGSGTPAVASGCEQTGAPDSLGFTPCVRPLAGTVASRSSCAPAEVLARTVSAQNAVTCEFGSGTGAGKSVTYYQGLSLDVLEAGAQTQMGGGSKIVRGTWSGGGMQGRYVAGIGQLAGLLIFEADGRPACGMLVSVDAAKAKETPEDLVRFFTEQLKPGVA
ncbi:Hsp70 family protein [Amycolatopsis saalfeldensis]|uniref:Hsp70 protein n=1 Tax=Amycolatopsis saalfeldensis TaxID=394193 RepID=A0A1H8WB79_9PSEU|nr:Hsp70 family protein [Amycolatopsis saalfeldensis]SEP24890.1 Hsp70 protein [Amycolatopsis saalfeldensis]